MRFNNSVLREVFNSKNIPYLFWILPLFHLVLGTLAHQMIGYFYLVSKDPEYFHLISGVAMGTLRLDTGYIDHPGIPIQMVIAVASRIVFFLSDNKSIIHDVIQHPEMYIFASNLLFNLIFAGIILLIGYKATKYTNDYRAGILLQLGFFANISLLTVSGRLLPEGFMLMPLGLLILLTIKYLYDEHPERQWRMYLILFSILVGWGLATKLSFAPFFLIPLIIIPGIKRKLALAGLSLLAFLIIAFPVISHLDYFWDWTSKMFVHSGKWGHGEANFMDLSQVPHRVYLLYQEDAMVFFLTGILLLETIALAIFRPPLKFLKKYFIVSFTTVASILVMILLITKHFAWHYFIPVMVFKSFLIFLIIWPIYYLIKGKSYGTYLPWTAVLVAFVVMIFSIHNLATSTFSKRNDHQMERLVDFKSQVSEDDILIISAHYAGAPWKAYAISGGMLLSGPGHKRYKQAFANEYPNIYMYYGWAKKFFKSYQYVDSKQLLEQNKSIYIYIGKGKDKDLDVIVDRFRNNNPGMNFTVEQVVSNEHGGDKMYRLKSNNLTVNQ